MDNAPDPRLQGIHARRSIRRFRPEPMPRAVIERCVSTGTMAPSASNRQDWLFHVLDRPAALEAFDADLRSAMAACARAAEADDSAARAEAGRGLETIDRNFRWRDVPVAVAVSCKPPASVLPGQDTAEGAVDALALAGSFASATMAAENILLAATALGWGGCCLTSPLAAVNVVKRHFHVPGRRRLVCLLALGRPDEAPAPPPRKPVPVVLRYPEATP